MSEARTPPHDVDAEAALLGAMLVSGDARKAAVERCSSADFYKPVHGHIFFAITALMERGEGIDAVTVVDELKRSGTLAAVGDPSVLISLMANTPGSANAAHYAKIVRDLAMMRSLIGVSGEIADIGYGAHQDVPAAIEKAVDLLSEIGASYHRDQRAAPVGDLVVTTMSDVIAEEVRWLWPGRIPLGKLSVIEGDPKGGKSTMALDLMARVSTGSVMPDATTSDLDGPADCVLMTAEDGLADTVRPRLDLAGADVNRIVAWEAVISKTDEGSELRMPSLPLDVIRLEALVNEHGAALVVVDVLAAYLGERVDTHHDADVRRALAPLAKMAERTGAAVVVLRHLNKGTGSKAMYRGGGSIGISGQARSILLVGRDPGDESADRRVLAVTACNLAASAPSLTFELRSESGRGAVRVAWTGSSSLSADELLADPGSTDERSERKEIVDLLTAWTEDGPIAVDEVRRRLRAVDLRPSESTLQRARRDAGVKVGAPSSFGGKRHYWRPAQSGHPSERHESDRTVAHPLSRDDDLTAGPVQSHIWETGLDSDPAEAWCGDDPEEEP